MRNKIYKEFVTSSNAHRKTDHAVGNNVLLKIKNSHSN